MAAALGAGFSSPTEMAAARSVLTTGNQTYYIRTAIIVLIMMSRRSMEGKAQAALKALPGETGLGRRQLLGAALLLALGVGTPFELWRRQSEGATALASSGQRRLAELLSDLVIPATDTPGALAAGVPAWLLLALSHGQAGTAEMPPGPYSVDHSLAASEPKGLIYLDLVGRQLNAIGGGDFASFAPARRFALLSQLDAEAFLPGHEGDPWRKIKELILTGYYTSEIGGSQELRYELAPGRWDPNVAIGPNERAFSSDWTAVDFG